MKIQYASDLHLEFDSNTQFLKEHPLQVVGDVLVLAGDILLFGEKLTSEHPFWDWCSDHYAQAIMSTTIVWTCSPRSTISPTRCGPMSFT